MSLSSWGNYPVINNTVITFDNAVDLRNTLKSEVQYIAHGNGRSYGDSALFENIIHVRPYNYFRNFDESNGIIQCQAGVLLSEMLEFIVPRGYFLTVTPGTKYITLGGAIASDVHGKNHHVTGAFSSCIVEFNMMLNNGDMVCCSPSGNSELFHATCGGMGLTGIILDAKIRLKKIQSSRIEQTTIKAGNLKETFEAFEAYKHYTYSVAWIDCLASGTDTGRSLLVAGEHMNDGVFSYDNNTKLTVPANFPSFTLNRYSIRVFNMLYYNRILRQHSGSHVDINSFFYPLDAIGQWNRIYGKNGFTQYQFVLPMESSYEGLRKILNAIAASGKGSFLAVLKLFGKGNENWLSFPMEGYTLALDFKIEPGLFGLLDRLDNIVTHHGGRIYLAKDARVGKRVFESGYPKIEQFRTLRKDYHMDIKFKSLQSSRLQL